MLVLGAGDGLSGVAGTASAITVTVTGVSVTVASGSETFGLLYQGQLPNSAASLFTVGAGLAFIIKTLSVTNPSGSNVSAIQLFVDGTTSSHSILGPLALNAGNTATLSDNGWSVTDSNGNILTASGSSGGGAANTLVLTTVTKTTSYPTTSLDCLVIANSTSPITITLFSGATAGTTQIIKNINTGVCTVAPASGNLDNLVSYTLNQWQSGTFSYSGSQWLIV